MRVPDELPKCVAWLGVKTERPDGKVLYNWHGTAFFLEVPFEIGVGLHRYLVTADHVLGKMADELRLVQETQIGTAQQVLRINQRDGRAAYVLLDLPDIAWWPNPVDPVADIAMAAFPLPVGAFDVRPLPLAMCLSDEDIATTGIGVGHEVIVTGRFRDMPGDKRNLSIVRTGNLAMIPSERVLIRDRGPMESYLIEARSTGGMSGSPAFVQHIYVNKQTGELDATYYLLGLVHGHWELDVNRGASAELETPEASGTDGRAVTEDSSVVEEGVNVGVAVVVPAQAIRDTLNHPMLAEAREREEMDIAQSHMPRPD